MARTSTGSPIVLVIVARPSNAPAVPYLPVSIRMIPPVTSAANRASAMTMCSMRMRNSSKSNGVTRSVAPQPGSPRRRSNA